MMTAASREASHLSGKERNRRRLVPSFACLPGMNLKSSPRPIACSCLHFRLYFYRQLITPNATISRHLHMHIVTNTCSSVEILSEKYAQCHIRETEAHVHNTGQIRAAAAAVMQDAGTGGCAACESVRCAHAGSTPLRLRFSVWLRRRQYLATCTHTQVIFSLLFFCAGAGSFAFDEMNNRTDRHTCVHSARPEERPLFMSFRKAWPVRETDSSNKRQKSAAAAAAAMRPCHACRLRFRDGSCPPPPSTKYYYCYSSAFSKSS